MEMSSKSQATLESIRKSFLDLIAVSPYNKIGIGDITSRANIARQTFYTYFQSKDELLMSFMDEIFDDLFEKIHPIITDVRETENVIVLYYQQWADNYDILLIILNADVDHLIYKRFRQYVNRTLGNILRRNKIAVPDPKIIEFVVDHMVGSSFAVTKHWMFENMPYSPNEMARFHMSLHSLNHPTTVKLLTAIQQTLPNPVDD